MFHSGSGAGDISWRIQRSLLRFRESIRRTLQYLQSISITGMSQWSPRLSGCTFRNGTAIPVAGEATSKKSALCRTGENHEDNWSISARLVGGLKGAARRVGLAMTDQELLPAAQNIPDIGELKVDRNRRGFEALMARLETELGQQRTTEEGVKALR